MQKKTDEIYSVILLGTSGVGKSTIAFYLEHGYPPPRSIRPTIAFGITHIVVNDAVLSLIDVGGQRKFLDMRFHERFVKNADGLVFVMDSSRKDYEADEQFGHARYKALSGQLNRRIIQIKKALARVKIGQYGICETCGNFINTKRLMVYPETTQCVKCQSKKKKS